MTTLTLSRLLEEEYGTPPFVIFDILQLLALLFLCLTLIPAVVSKSVVRMRSWYALIASCMIYRVSFLLLVGQQTGLLV